MMYTAGFDVSKLTLGNITLTTAGKPDVVVNMSDVQGVTRLAAASTKMFHFGTNKYVALNNPTPDSPAYVLEDWDVTGYAAGLQELVQTEATAQGWVTPSFLGVGFDEDNSALQFPDDRPFGYLIAHASYSVGVSWSSSVGRSFMGFSANKSAAAIQASDQVPDYCIAPRIIKASNVSEMYEPRGITSHAYPEHARGLGFSLRRHLSPLYLDFDQQFEYAWKVKRLEATSAHPFTFQHLWEYARCEHPFIAYDLLPEISTTFVSSPETSNAYVLLLREEGSVWEPERATTQNGLESHVHFATHVVGAAQVA